MWVSSRTGSLPEAIRSRSTLPGPTEGSWSASPTSSNPAAGGSARRSWYISTVSTMEASSTISRSQPRGSAGPLRKPPVRQSYSNSRGMVFASRPQDSPRPVGARPAGGDRRLLARGRGQGLRLRRVQGQIQAALGAGDVLFRLGGERDARRGGQAVQKQGDPGFCGMQSRQVHASPFQDDPSGGRQLPKAFRQVLFRQLQQHGGPAGQLIRGQAGVAFGLAQREQQPGLEADRKSTRLHSSHGYISYAV